MSMNVYLAARYGRRDELNGYAAELAALGIGVTSRWLTAEHAWSGGDGEVPDRAVAARFAADDLADIRRADIVVCFTEPPDSGFSRGGRHVEFGYALALGKRVIAIGPVENIFYARPVYPCADWASGLRALAMLARMTDDEPDDAVILSLADTCGDRLVVRVNRELEDGTVAVVGADEVGAGRFVMLETRSDWRRLRYACDAALAMFDRQTASARSAVAS